MQSVRETGDWEAWISFFLTGVIETANQATETAQSIIAMFGRDRQHIEQSGKATTALLTIHHYLQSNPITTTVKLREACDISLPTVLRNLATLESLGIVKEITGKERHKVFVYDEYLALLSKGTEPLRW